MQLKNSLSIFLCNTTLIYKLLLFFLVILIIAGSLVVSIANPFINEIANLMRIQGIEVSWKAFFASPLDSVSEIFSSLDIYISSHTSEFTVSVLYLCLIVLLVRFLASLTLVATSKIIFDRMTTGGKINFVPAFISTIKQTFPYALLSTVIIGIIDLAIFAFSTCLLFWTLPVLKALAPLLVLSINTLLLSLRICITSQWLPIISEGEKNPLVAFWKAIKQSKRVTWEEWPVVFSLLAVFYILLFALFVPSFGFVILLLIPSLLVILCAFFHTVYFKMHERKYYIDNGYTIFDPNGKKC